MINNMYLLVGSCQHSDFDPKSCLFARVWRHTGAVIRQLQQYWLHFLRSRFRRLGIAKEEQYSAPGNLVGSGLQVAKHIGSRRHGAVEFAYTHLCNDNICND